MNRQLAEEKTLYENQQKDLKLLYVSGKDENLKTEKEYNEAMEHLTIMHLERVLKIANLDADQQRTIEQQLLDFKVKCLQDEEKERKKLEDAAQKKKTNWPGRRNKGSLNRHNSTGNTVNRSAIPSDK